jgi:Flp pilus assembly protein TadG
MREAGKPVLPGRIFHWDSQGMFRVLTKFLRRNVSRFSNERIGTTAVEFALIAPPFFALLFAIFETTLFLFAQATLQNAADQAGRLFMTGQVQNAGTTQSAFQTEICPMVSALFTCSNLMVNVSAFSSSSSISTTAPTLTYNKNGTVSNTWSYSPGTPGQLMVVQLIYQWPIVGIPLGSLFPNLGNGTTEMMGVTAFRVEPY